MHLAKVFVTCKNYILLSNKNTQMGILASQCSVPWDPNGVFWLGEKWLTLFALYRSSKVFLSIRCNGLKHDTQRPDQEDCLQHWEQQMHHASVWMLSWHCNSERISWSGIQRTWRWLEISLLSVGNNGPSDTDNLYNHLQRIQIYSEIGKNGWIRLCAWIS